ncbi:UDP-N-acetylglucosamine 4,6-dehydratase (inverting) [Candidatus Woesearchaeota archaeon]|uniref:UDP-N-acetylglucosamine 4,6-dehydratase n=1 Tax=Candidatus Jorgensenbacteria bacterium GW2011_GWF2_41_8 TaxID=1618667 RepID=A0A0G0XHX8_9BACT|nr:MAG: UDP-N-acetylglucosamine 4,6-dehydratase [Candidatus Jorgensenbacteria bacterium GW2011_GWF2_41_8]MBS3161932.1 UDP-N-acetylglucosamine 4,6-dehydratase (inverting) [Candidatus Woesearchaeota archaeon]
MNTKIIDNKVVLITGGTGSFGKNFAKFLLENSKLKKLIIFSRDELKQSQMRKELHDERLRFFLGDVREIDRLQQAFRDVDIVIHAAALKQVPTLEYNPFEAIKTNILGSHNVISAAIDQKVEKALLISTDKAVHPINLYGATKMCAEKLFTTENSYVPYAKGQTKLSSVRYGNVIGSRGSIVESLLKNRVVKKVQITDPEMTRFWITLDQTFALVLFALQNMEGGELFVPKIPSMKLVDLFNALRPGIKKEVIGIRPGEKLHEILLTEQEALHALELEKCFVIVPEYLHPKRFEKYFKIGKKIAKNFRFTSNTNTAWLLEANLKALLTKEEKNLL